MFNVVILCNVVYFKVSLRMFSDIVNVTILGLVSNFKYEVIYIMGNMFAGRKKFYWLGGVGVFVLVLLIFLGISNSAADKSGGNVQPASYSVIDNKQIKPYLENVIKNSLNKVAAGGGEMNYFVKGFNIDLSVYNPSGISGQRAASYIGEPDGNGGHYQKFKDEENFSATLADKIVPKKDDTFALWKWDGDKEYQNGSFIADVGLYCSSPSIGETPTFKMCKTFIPSSVTVKVVEGFIKQVDDFSDESNKTTRTLTYGITQAVTGVLFEAYK